MIYLTNIQTYLRELCAEHVELRDGVNGTAFVPIFPSDESAASITGIKSKYLKVVDVSQTGRDDDSNVWVVLLEFIKNVPPTTGTQRTAIEEAWNEMQRIMLDFDARIRQDAEDEDKCFFANNLLQPTMELRERVDQSGYGWAYTWRFITDKPRHDPARWV